MIHTSKYRLHSKAKLLDQDVQGVEILLEGLITGASIHASQRQQSPISLGSRSTQWLDCETSGSTGKPKTIRRSPESWQVSFEQNQRLFDLNDADHYAVLGSLGHSLSLYAALEAMHIGATLSVLSNLSPKQQLRALKSRGASVLYATPTQLKQLVYWSAKEGITGIEAMRLIMVGGGKLLGSEKQRISDLFLSAEIVEFYGTSETSFISLGRADTPSGSVGRPYPGVEITIAGSDAPYVSGQIRVKSPYLAQSYVGAETPDIIDKDGFVTTGEIGYVDADGYLYLQGRSDRMITVSDRNIFLEAIEQAIEELDDIVICAVVAKPDSLRGSRTVCFIEQSHERYSTSDIRQHCRNILGEHHVPKEIHFLQALPLTPSGKPDLQNLSRMALELS